VTTQISPPFLLIFFLPTPPPWHTPPQNFSPCAPLSPSTSPVCQQCTQDMSRRGTPGACLLDRYDGRAPPWRGRGGGVCRAGGLAARFRRGGRRRRCRRRLLRRLPVVSRCGSAQSGKEEGSVTSSRWLSHDWGRRRGNGTRRHGNDGGRRRSKEDHAGEAQRKARVIGLQNGQGALLAPPPAPPVLLGCLFACIFLLVLAIVEIDVEVIDAVLHGYVGLLIE